MTPLLSLPFYGFAAITIAAVVMVKLFDEHGYEATTIEQIAAAANISRATYFNYFASKEAVVLDRDPQARDQWRALLEGPPRRSATSSAPTGETGSWAASRPTTH